jgi:thiamine pyrophosphate-dependent acetolactate synthase large subunit-like protein
MSASDETVDTSGAGGPIDATVPAAGPATTTGGRALVDALVAHGVDTVFGIPGTHNLPIYAALAERGVRHVSPRHEQGAGYAADGHARVSGQPGVVITTSGPALLNAATAAAQSYSDSVPVLLVSPGVPSQHPARGNGELHEVKDQSGALDAIVAYSHRVGSVAEIPGAVAEAFAAMTHARPRPVHLEIPLDLLAATAPAAPVTPIPRPRISAAPAELAAAATALTRSRRPVLIVGGGARGAPPQVRALAEHLGAPVVTSTNGKGVMPEDHPLAVGAGLHHRAVVDLVADADVIVAVGTELAPADVWEPLDLDDRTIRVDVDPAQTQRNARPRVALVGDAAGTVDGLLHHLGAEVATTPPGTVDDLRHDLGAEVATAPAGTGAIDGAALERASAWRDRHQADAREQGATWLGLLDVLHVHLGRDGIVVGDSTMACYYGALSNLPAYHPGAFLYPTGLGTLGYAVPAATGAKLARPDLRVLALSGDGGLLFTLAELAAAAELELALPIVVVDNGGYGEIEREMHARDQPLVGVALGRPDLPTVARGLGCHGHDLSSLAELPDALETAFGAARPTLLRIPEALCGRPDDARPRP